MEGPKILVNEPVRSPRKDLPAEPDFGWILLGWAGWVFLLAGLMDIGLAWIPLRLGNPEWEFGTITRSFDSVPVPFLGSALIMASGLARGRVWWGKVGVVVLWLLTLWVLVSGVLYALNVPLALRAVKEPVVAMGLKKAILRTSLQILFYAVATAGMGWIGAKRFFRRARV